MCYIVYVYIVNFIIGYFNITNFKFMNSFLNYIIIIIGLQIFPMIRGTRNRENQNNGSSENDGRNDIGQD